MAVETFRIFYKMSPPVLSDLVPSKHAYMGSATGFRMGPIMGWPISSLQCYSVLSDMLVKNELCIPMERGSNVLSTGEGFNCLSSPSKLKIAVRFCSIYKKTISFSAIVL